MATTTRPKTAPSTPKSVTASAPEKKTSAVSRKRVNAPPKVQAPEAVPAEKALRGAASATQKVTKNSVAKSGEKSDKKAIKPAVKKAMAAATKTVKTPQAKAERAPVAGATKTTASVTSKVAPAKTAVPEATDMPEAITPEYWEEACRHLIKKDRILRKIIPQYTGMGLQSRGDAFSTLARSIVGQQISTSAAAAVWGRVEQSVRGKFTAAKVLALDVETLRACGLSMRKTEYLRDLALHVRDGHLNVKAWQNAEDEDIIAELTTVRGIGRWTAEMFLMFYLMRPNVLPLDDAGLIQGISRNYFSGEPVSRSDAREVAEAWKPWRTVATWYMWRSLAQPQAY